MSTLSLIFVLLNIALMTNSEFPKAVKAGSAYYQCSSSSDSNCQSMCSQLSTTGFTFTGCCPQDTDQKSKCICCNYAYQTNIGMPNPATTTCPSTFATCPCNCFKPELASQSCGGAAPRNTTIMTSDPDDVYKFVSRNKLA